MMAEEDFAREFPGEAQLVEFKSGIGPDPLQDTIVAFSNAKGGVILVGVSDDGTIVGRRLDPGTADSIYQTFRDTKDPGKYTIHEVQVGEKTVVAISVAREAGRLCANIEWHRSSPQGNPRRAAFRCRASTAHQRAVSHSVRAHAD